MDGGLGKVDNANVTHIEADSDASPNRQSARSPATKTNDERFNALRPRRPSSGEGAMRDQRESRFVSSLTKTVENGLKQYKLNGVPIEPAYPTKSRLADSSALIRERSEIVKKNSVAIYQRRNPASPVLKKEKAGLVRETQEKIEVRNELALFVSNHPNSKHLVVEIFSGEKDGQPNYITRQINGFSMEDSARLEALRRDLGPKEFRAKMDELSDAVKWLNNSGYFHNDITHGNIMYDVDNKAMALIDFEDAGRHQRYEISEESQLIDSYKDIYMKIRALTPDFF